MDRRSSDEGQVFGSNHVINHSTRLAGHGETLKRTIPPSPNPIVSFIRTPIGRPHTLV